MQNLFKIDILSSEHNDQNGSIAWKWSRIEELYDCMAGIPKPRLPSQYGAIKV